MFGFFLTRISKYFIGFGSDQGIGKARGCFHLLINILRVLSGPAIVLRVGY